MPLLSRDQTRISPKTRSFVLLTFKFVFVYLVAIILFFSFNRSLFEIAVAQEASSFCEDRYGVTDINSCYRILWDQGLYFIDPITGRDGGADGGNQCISRGLPTITNKQGLATAINQYIDDYVGPNRTSPFQGLGQAFVDGGVAAGINPMLAVAQLQHESGLVAGDAINKGWAGNVYLTEEAARSQDQSQRTTSNNAFGREASDLANQPHVFYYSEKSDRIRYPYKWPSWADSLSGEDNWFSRVNKGSYANIPMDDLTAYINRYAPPSDGNDVSGYVSAITATMEKITALAGSSLSCGTGSGVAGGNLGQFTQTGSVIPCQGQPHQLTRQGVGVNWSDLPPTGNIGQNSAGQNIDIYIRDACAGQTNVRTVVVGATIHASGEAGGQVVAHELLYNKQLPPDVRIIVIPVINGAGFTGQSPAGRVNKNGVNLNRNFDYDWANAKQGDADKIYPNFKGSSPASEPETQAIQNYLLSLGKTSLVLSYHSNLDIVYYSGPDKSLSTNMARKYAAVTGQTTNGNTGAGFFEAWYNAKTGTPALLVEASSERSFEYFDKHADAVVTILNDGSVPSSDGTPVVQNNAGGGSGGPVTYAVTVNTIPGVANVGDYKFPQIPHDGVSLTECPTRQWTGANKLRTDIGVLFEGAPADKYYNTITCTGGPIHQEGRAQDVYAWVSRGEMEKGNSIFEWLISNADLMGIQYIKYWKVEWNPTQGVKCVNSVDQRNNHSTHIHYELNWDGAKANTPYFTSGQGRNSYITINQDICPALDPSNPNQEIRQ